MAEFSEVMKQYIRMCRLSTCEKCVLHGMDVLPCGARAKENPKEFERRVMEWAEAHPEPVYPTWKTWLISEWVANTPKIDEPIPADIAKKLGIKPKEG